MFNRRLTLLMGLTVLAMAALVAQLSRLTVAQGAVHRREAEAKLVAKEWTPAGGAGRGRILDRKGRVLAQDRPSFDVMVDYKGLAGTGPDRPVGWVMRHAGAAARKDYKDRWTKASAEERARIMDPYIAAYQGHLDRMWREVGRATGLNEERLEKARGEIVKRVAAKAEAHYAMSLHKEMDSRLIRGEEISEDFEDDVEDRLRRPIHEEQSWHVLLANVADDAGFELIRLTGERVDVQVPDGKGGVRLDEGVPLMPVLTVVPSGDREYPYDSMSVDVDLSTLPDPVKGTGKKTIAVDGVAYHVLGRMKDKAQKEDNDRRELRAFGKRNKGTKEYEIKPDQEFAERVLMKARGERDEDRQDRGEYHDDDQAGLSGIEASQEDVLRGLRGLRTERRDTGETMTVPPERGRDVQLTLDIMLQARVQAAMSPALGLAVAQEWHGKENPTVPVGSVLDGAAVVMEVDTGDILAMVSTPTMSREALREHPEYIFGDPMNEQLDVPWIDRAIARPYPPGSIAKAMILNGAVKFGKFNLDSTIDCTGHLFPDKPNMFRCWIYKSHGGLTHTQTLGHTLSAPEALMVSCNIFFFTLGQKLGVQGVVNTYRMFGLGEPMDIGLDRPGQPGAVFTGYLGFTKNAAGKEVPCSAVSPGTIGIQDAIQMGIGQGPVAWTPLHAANAYCTLARRGVKMPPRLVNEPSSVETQDIGLDSRAVKEALHGLWLSANDMQHGTGAYLTINGRTTSHWNAGKDVMVWGKTGTAAAPTVMVRETMKDKDGKEVPNPLWEKGVEAGVIAAASKEPDFKLPKGTRALRWGDHSWFVVLVGPKAEGRPKYAIAVMMEYAGSGGKVSGPIVNQIIHALVTEGYL